MASNRLGIAQALVALVSGIQNPNTNQPLYSVTKLGAIFNPGAATSFAEITHYQGKGGPAGSGGTPQVGWRIQEDVTYQITSGFGPYEKDSTSAQESMLAAQDILLPTIRQHFLLPDPSNPINAIQSAYNILIEQVDRSQPVRFPSGNVFLLWHVFVTVSQQYEINLQIP
jgi:hypothetical protein